MFTRKPIRVVNGIVDFIEEEDDYIEDYEQKSKDKNGSMSLETNIMKNICQMIISPLSNSNIVDVGCGCGHIINNIDGYHKIGIDISLNQLSFLDENVTKVRCNVEDIPLPNYYADYVICTDVYEHVRNPDVMISEIHRILCNGGSLLFAVPWKQNLSVYDDPEYKKKYKQYKYKHLRSIDERDIGRILSDKFSIVSTTEIDAIRDFMDFSPYSIKFFHMRKK